MGFVITMLDGEEIRAAAGDRLSVNADTGVLTVQRIDGFEEVTSHYSPAAWRSVTQRVKSTAVHSSLLTGAAAPRATGAPARG